MFKIQLKHFQKNNFRKNIFLKLSDKNLMHPVKKTRNFRNTLQQYEMFYCIC